MDPPFEGLTAQIEGLWRHMLEDLRLYPIDKAPLLNSSLRVKHQISGCSAYSNTLLYTETIVLFN